MMEEGGYLSCSPPGKRTSTAVFLSPNHTANPCFSLSPSLLSLPINCPLRHRLTYSIHALSDLFPYFVPSNFVKSQRNPPFNIDFFKQPFNIKIK